eukprot:3805027-Pyramimonas_sp.AAC.1
MLQGAGGCLGESPGSRENTGCQQARPPRKTGTETTSQGMPRRSVPRRRQTSRGDPGSAQGMRSQ